MRYKPRDVGIFVRCTLSLSGHDIEVRHFVEDELNDIYIALSFIREGMRDEI